MAVFIKVIVLFLFVAIFFSLGSAMVSLVRRKEKTNNSAVKALTWRIGLSLFLFVLLLLGFLFGWIQPHPLQ